jgi:pre-mRNA-processing factor 6
MHLFSSSAPRVFLCLQEEWEAIPEIGDYTIKNKKVMQSFVPVPDTLLAKAAMEKQLDTTAAAGGLETPSTSATPVNQDLTAVGEGRGTVLSLKLDNMADSVSGQTVVDPKGYLTDLKSMKITSGAPHSVANVAHTRHLALLSIDCVFFTCRSP